MKKIKNDDDVVLVMSKREFITIDMLVTTGVYYESTYGIFSDKDLDRFRALRDKLEQ